MKLAGDFRRSRGVIDGDGAGAKRADSAVRSESDVAKVVVIANAGKNEIRAVRGLGGACRQTAAEARHPGIGLGAGPVEHDDLVAMRLEMARHGKAHHAEPDPGDFAHWLNSLVAGASTFGASG